MRVIQSIYSDGGTRGHIKTPLSGTKSIRKTQFGFEKKKCFQLDVSLLLSMNVLSVFVSVGCFVCVCVGVQEWVRQSKLFIQVQWSATH